MGKTYHHGRTCACAHQCGGGGSSCNAYQSPVRELHFGRSHLPVAIGEKEAGTGGEENCTQSMSYCCCDRGIIMASVGTYHPASWGNHRFQLAFTLHFHQELRLSNPPVLQIQRNPQGKQSSRTLLVVTTGDLEDVALEFVTEGVAGNLFQR